MKLYKVGEINLKDNGYSINREKKNMKTKYLLSNSEFLTLNSNINDQTVNPIQ